MWQGDRWKKKKQKQQNQPNHHQHLLQFLKPKGTPHHVQLNGPGLFYLCSIESSIILTLCLFRLLPFHPEVQSSVVVKETFWPADLCAGHQSAQLSQPLRFWEGTAGHKETANLLSDKSSSCGWRNWFLTCTVLQLQEQWAAMRSKWPVKAPVLDWFDQSAGATITVLARLLLPNRSGNASNMVDTFHILWNVTITAALINWPGILDRQTSTTLSAGKSQLTTWISTRTFCHQPQEENDEWKLTEDRSGVTVFGPSTSQWAETTPSSVAALWVDGDV